MPDEQLVDECPVYVLEPQLPISSVYPQPAVVLRDEASWTDALLALLSSPSIASKRWAYEQYDSIVGSRSVRRAGASDAAVLTLAPDGGKASIATSIDGNGRRVACDPYTGAVEAVLECARNL